MININLDKFLMLFFDRIVKFGKGMLDTWIVNILSCSGENCRKRWR